MFYGELDAGWFTCVEYMCTHSQPIISSVLLSTLSVDPSELEFAFVYPHCVAEWTAAVDGRVMAVVT